MDKTPINENLENIYLKKETIEYEKEEKITTSDTSVVLKKSCLNYITSFINFLKSLTIEGFVFIFMFSYVIKSISSMTMIIDKVCRVDLEYPDDICRNLSNYKTIKAEVETVANNYHLYHTLLMFVPSIALACFIGPWSDQHGRKPPLILASIGAVLDGIGTTLCAVFMDTSVVYYLIPPIFNSCSGGFVVVFTVAYSYVSDISTSGSRTFKYALMEVAMGLGAPVGSLAGGWIYKFWGYVPVFSCMSIFSLIGLLWVAFLIKETRGMDNKVTIATKARNFLRLSSLVESYKATAKPRPHKGRLQIWMLLIATSVAVVTLTAQSIAYLYVYHIFDWSNTKFSTVSAIFSVFSLIVMLTAVPLLTKVLKLGDAALGIIGTVSLIAKNFGTGLAGTAAFKGTRSGQGIYYLANLLGLLYQLSTLAGRSRISKIVSKHELGKVFAFISSAEGIVPVFATILVSKLFNATVKTDNPGITYYILTLFTVINLIIYIWLGCLPSVNYEEMQEQKADEKVPKIEECSA